MSLSDKDVEVLVLRNLIKNANIGEETVKSVMDGKRVSSSRVDRISARIETRRARMLAPLEKHLLKRGL